jgi:F-type H+-transporting ATPase subunit gamma
MPSLLNIRRRIRSVRNLQQVTRAVKMVAAVKVRRARSQLMQFRPYSDEIARLLVRLIPRTLGIEHPLFARREPGKLRALVITSDRGLCGGFNVNVTRHAAAFQDEHPGADLSFTAIGRKGIRYFRRRGVPLVGTYEGVYDEFSYSTVMAIANHIIEEYVAERIDGYYVIYTLFVSAIQQRCIVRQILPFDLEEIVREAELLAKRQPGKEKPTPEVAEERSSDHYISEPEPEELCEKLLTRYLATTLFRAVLESIASEFAARMNAMDNATTNAGEMIDTLTLQYHRVRQSAITTEVCEVVAGAEAMK